MKLVNICMNALGIFCIAIFCCVTNFLVASLTFGQFDKLGASMKIGIIGVVQLAVLLLLALCVTQYGTIKQYTRAIRAFSCNRKSEDIIDDLDYESKKVIDDVIG